MELKPARMVVACQSWTDHFSEGRKSRRYRERPWVWCWQGLHLQRQLQRQVGSILAMRTCRQCCG